MKQHAGVLDMKDSKKGGCLQVQSSAKRNLLEEGSALLSLQNRFCLLTTRSVIG